MVVVLSVSWEWYTYQTLNVSTTMLSHSHTRFLVCTVTRNVQTVSEIDGIDSLRQWLQSTHHQRIPTLQTSEWIWHCSLCSILQTFLHITHRFGVSTSQDVAVLYLRYTAVRFHWLARYPYCRLICAQKLAGTFEHRKLWFSSRILFGEYPPQTLVVAIDYWGSNPSLF